MSIPAPLVVRAGDWLAAAERDLERGLRPRAPAEETWLELQRGSGPPAPWRGGKLGPDDSVWLADRLGRVWPLARPVAAGWRLRAAEELVAFLAEALDGGLPLWLAPEQLRVLPVSERSASEADALRRRCQDEGLRVSLAEEGPLAGRLRRAWLERVPVVAVIGPREAGCGEVSVRVRGSERPDALPQQVLIEALRAQSASWAGSLNSPPFAPGVGVEPPVAGRRSGGSFVNAYRR